MDHRCLYGHRVPQDFAFAIKSRQCPVCGAPTVTVRGYQLARALARQVGLDAMQAFKTVRFIEEDFVLTPARREAPAPAEEAPAAPVTEIEVPADEIEVPADEIELSSEELEVPEEEAAEAATPEAAPAEAPEPPARSDEEPRRPAAAGDEDFGELEAEFFRAAET